MSSETTVPSLPVLLFGSGITALAVIQTYGPKGIQVVSLDDQPAYVRRSRYFQASPVKSAPSLNPADLKLFLEQLPYNDAILLPSSDHACVALARLVESGECRYRCCISSTEAMETLTDKGRFAQLLCDLDVPHPETVLIESEHDIVRALKGRTGKWFLKPRDSLSFHSHFEDKGVWVESLDQALGSYRELSAMNLSMMLQEFIPGEADQHYYVEGFIDRHGRICGLLGRRRLRIYPPGLGLSTYMVIVSTDEVASACDTIRKLVSRLKYRGIFSAEFKLDGRDSEFKLLEVNARPWWYVGVAAMAGVDVLNMAYLDACDAPVAAVDKYNVGQRYIYPYFDFYAAFDLWRAGKLSLTDWISSWLSSKHAFFRRSDPLPSITGAVELSGSLARGLFRRLLRR